MSALLNLGQCVRALRPIQTCGQTLLHLTQEHSSQAAKLQWVSPTIPACIHCLGCWCALVAAVITGQSLKAAAQSTPQSAAAAGVPCYSCMYPLLGLLLMCTDCCCYCCPEHQRSCSVNSLVSSCVWCPLLFLHVSNAGAALVAAAIATQSLKAAAHSTP